MLPSFRMITQVLNQRAVVGSAVRYVDATVTILHSS